MRQKLGIFLTPCLLFLRPEHTRRQIAATRSTTTRQIALCAQSSDKSYALIAAIGCSDKSPGVNASTFGDRLIRILSPRQNFVAATCRTKLNQFDFVRHVAATKFCRSDKIFDKILLFTR